jgi:deoxyinosine 3'endonuclease (endonuclease V)
MPSLKDIQQWTYYQNENAKNIIKTDTFNIDDVLYIAGLDISFDTVDNNKGCAYITIYDVIRKKIVYEDYNLCILSIHYMSGFLGFREVPEYLKLLTKLKETKPEFYPHVLQVDGGGILHHRGFGSASHLGFVTGLASIGVAKTLLHIDGLNQKECKVQSKIECKQIGDYIHLIGKSGKLYGVALKSSSADNPIYVSIGHNISLKSAIKLTLQTCQYRLPEPIRNSDIKSQFRLWSGLLKGCNNDLNTMP